MEISIQWRDRNGGCSIIVERTAKIMKSGTKANLLQHLSERCPRLGIMIATQES